jgi:hypothetical protein
MATNTIRKALALDTKAVRATSRAAFAVSRAYKAWLKRGDAIERELAQRECERAHFLAAMGHDLMREHENTHQADLVARRNARLRHNSCKNEFCPCDKAADTRTAKAWSHGLND